MRAAGRCLPLIPSPVRARRGGLVGSGNAEQMLFETQSRIPGESVRVGTESPEKILDFLLYLLFAGDIGPAQADRVVFPGLQHFLLPGIVPTKSVSPQVPRAGFAKYPVEGTNTYQAGFLQNRGRPKGNFHYGNCKWHFRAICRNQASLANKKDRPLAGPEADCVLPDH
jgi:hypothetical protein